MGHGALLFTALVVYVFGVGHLNLTVGLAAGLAMLGSYRRHGGALFDEL